MKKLLLKIKHRKILKQIKEIHFEPSALKKYRFDVKGNFNEPNEILEKKLKRNFVLGKNVKDGKLEYGNLLIHYKGLTITDISNRRGKTIKLNIDEELKRDLDILLGIE